jgi:LuxR family transcriptional regulator, maltose regulon positive regulatory protein
MTTSTYGGFMAEDALVDDDLAAGRAALSRGSWSEARARFLGALGVRETPAALEGLSWAAWWLDDVEGCLDARVRAYHRYRDEGEARSAARMAVWLGDDHLEFRRADAVAGGWFARAARILEQLEPGPEHGWLAVFEAHDALGRADLDTAWAHAEQARDLGRRHGRTDLEMFAVATEGVIHAERGEIVEGLRCLDEAAAAALAGEYENLAPASWSCCLMMSTCERVRDFERAAQWCQQIERFSRRMDATFLRGVCRSHHGVIQAWRGSWERAERELTEAFDDLSVNRPSWRSEAAVRLGHLRRRQGRLDEAAQLFAQAESHPSALHGMAALRLEQGDPATARELLHRVLRQAAAGSPAGRADALELLVRVELALGEPDAANRRLDELRSVAGGLATEAMAAALAECEGLLAAAGADHERACDHLEDAIDLFTRLRAPVEAARARTQLATSLLELGRAEAARRELRQARDDLAEAGADPERGRAEALLTRIDAIRDGRAGQNRTLTDRQVEVLRLVAEGLSDQQIADRLVLSPHTVHRHVANIYTRLGCSSRPAAVAEAARQGLL